MENITRQNATVKVYDYVNDCRSQYENITHIDSSHGNVVVLYEGYNVRAVIPNKYELQITWNKPKEE